MMRNLATSQLAEKFPDRLPKSKVIVGGEQDSLNVRMIHLIMAEICLTLVAKKVIKWSGVGAGWGLAYLFTTASLSKMEILVLLKSP